MRIEFHYSEIYDIVYHILAHMKVENASNLYSATYIHTINQAKNRCDSIEEAVSRFADYYNEKFERLGIINFLPFYCSSVQNLISTTESYERFTTTDKERFVLPFIQLIKKEYAFYKSYWDTLYDSSSLPREAFESWVKKELNRYQPLFSYFQKSCVIGLSYSLTNNGRGYMKPETFNAVVPFVYDESQYKSTFFQILHEYTHQFTDHMLGESIRMDDGTHDISENAVILFDYYLIKKLCEQDIASYLEWVSSLLNIEQCDENLFLSVFSIKDDINEKLLEIVDRI